MKVYVADINKLNITPELLSHFPNRVENAKSYKQAEDVLRSYGAGFLLWKVLGLEDKDISIGEHGKPLANGVSFNLSHSGDYVVLACDENPIGVDIEKPEEKNLSSAKKVFTENEIAWMNESPLEHFAVLWTLKEAVMKNLGTGFSLPAKSFEVLPLVKGNSIVINDTTLVAKTTKYKDYTVSVVTTL